MKWFAINGPDGTLIERSLNDMESRCLWAAFTLGMIPGMPACNTVGDVRREAELLGYRCVEVELAEPGTTDALKRARGAWDTLVTCHASVNAPPEHRALMEVAMQALGEVLGRVTDNAASDGGEGEKP